MLRRHAAPQVSRIIWDASADRPLHTYYILGRASLPFFAVIRRTRFSP